MTETEEFNEN